MNNKYDMWLTKEEQEKLLANIKAISDYATNLVKDFDADVSLEGEWSYHDTIWGTKKCTFVVQKRNGKIEIEGNHNHLELYYPRDFFGEGREEDYKPFSDKYKIVYALGLIENWPSIKTQVNDQLERAKKLKAMTSGFKV